MLRVCPGYDVADSEIIKRMVLGDLVITADIPLAAEAIAKGGHVIDPRGERFHWHPSSSFQDVVPKPEFGSQLKISQ